MKAIDRHPPVDRRCQIYVTDMHSFNRELVRCNNPGTHWVQWGGCGCNRADADPDVCEEDFYSWECDGPCSTPINEAA